MSSYSPPVIYLKIGNKALGLQAQTYNQPQKKTVLLHPME